MTINDIIGLPEQFEGIDEKFEGIDEKFEKIDQRFDDLAASTQREFQAVRTEIREMEVRIVGAIEKIDYHFSSYISVIDDRITRLERR